MIIKSFLPNPVGKDAGGEKITLFNNGSQAVNLSGWWVADAAGKKYILSATAAPGREIVLPYRITKISLNNNGETVFLYNNEGRLIDKLSYVGQAAEGMTIARNGASDGIYNKADAFEAWPDLQSPVNRRPHSASLFLTMFIIALVLAGIFIYAYKKLYRDKEICR